MSDDNHSRDEGADAFVHPDYVRAAVSAIQAAHAGGSRSVEFFDEVRIGLSAALPLALADLREQLVAANARAETAEAREVRDFAVCVCGNRECPDYWHSVHEQMNIMRVRADQNAASFTAAMLEEICELRTEADELRARLDGPGEERVLMYRIIGAIEHAYALNTYVELEPGETAPTVESLWAEVRELRGDAPDAAADGHSATQAGGDRHGETTTTTEGTGTETTRA